MLDVGFSEILLTSAIALIVLGPERLPKVARQVGNWMGRARAMARQLSEQLEREVSADELLQQQTKPGSGTSTPPSAAADFDAPPAPTIAPPQAAAPQPADAAQVRDAASTTAAAMHPAATDPVPRNE